MICQLEQLLLLLLPQAQWQQGKYFTTPLRIRNLSHHSPSPPLSPLSTSSKSKMAAQFYLLSKRTRSAVLSHDTFSFHQARLCLSSLYLFLSLSLFLFLFIYSTLCSVTFCPLSNSLFLFYGLLSLCFSGTRCGHYECIQKGILCCMSTHSLTHSLTVHSLVTAFAFQPKTHYTLVSRSLEIALHRWHR